MLHPKVQRYQPEERINHYILIGQTFAVAVDAVLVVLVLEHLADEDLQSVLHLLLALLLHLGASVAVGRHPDCVDEREVFARALTDGAEVLVR